MRNQAWKKLGVASVLLAAPIVAVVVSQSPRAAAADEENDGRIVAISPDEGGELPESDQAADQPAVEAPKYWIGLQGRPIESAALRTHLQLADDVGVLVESVVPGSPAETAKLRQHDIIIAVNGEPISDLAALQKVVAEGAEKPIELKVIRLAKETKVEVTPEERPADAPQGLPADGRLDLGGPMGDVDALLRRFQQPGGVQGFDPGKILGGQAFNLSQMPNGVSVSIARQGEGPAEITVKKGDETWTLNSDDEEAIKKLPDDVRPFVEQMLEGSRTGRPGVGAAPFDLGELQGMLRDRLGNLDAEVNVDEEAILGRVESAGKRTEKASERLLERMEQMEQRIRELQDQLQENENAPRTNGEDNPSKT